VVRSDFVRPLQVQLGSWWDRCRFNWGVDDATASSTGELMTQRQNRIWSRRSVRTAFY